MTNAGIAQDRYLLPLAICAAGAALAWLTGNLTGLLVVVAGISIYGGRRASFATAAVLGLVLAALLVVGWDAVPEREWSLRLAVGLAAGLGISGLVHFDQVSRTTVQDENEARLIVESMPGHGWSADPNGKYVYVSPSTSKYVGEPTNSLDRIEGTDEFGWRHVVHPDDYERVVARWLHSLKTGEPYENEHRIRRFDGEYRWFRNTGMPSLDASGRIAGWYGTTIDIHDQKSAELALRDRERELAQLVDMVPSHVWRLTPDGELTFFNRRMADFLGAGVADTARREMSRLAALLEAVHPDDAGELKNALDRSLVTGRTFEMRYRLRRFDGVYRWMSSRAEPLRDPDGRILQWYGLCHDIDEQMLAEQTLRQSERRLQVLVDAIPAYIWCLTPEGTPFYFNKRVLDQIGLTVKDLTTPEGGLSLVSVHPGDRPRVQQALDRSLRTGVPFIEKYRQRRGKSAPHRWTEGRAEPLRDEDGRIVQWYGVYSDIHEEVVAQQALQEREFQLKQLVHMVPSYLWRLNPDGEPNFFNKRLIDFLGLDIATAGKMDTDQLAALIGTIVHPDDRTKLRNALYRCLATGEHFLMKYRLRRADGVYRWMEGRAEPMHDQGGRIVQWYGLCHDIDDQMRAEEALRRSEQRYRHLFHHTPVGLWQLDGRPYVSMFEQLRADGVEDLGAYLDDHPEFLSNALSALVIDEVNGHAIQMFGARDRRELLDEPTHWMWRESIDTLRRSMESRWRGEESFQETTKLVTLDGRVIDVLYTVTRPPTVEGLPISLVSMIDLTERVRAQQALRNSEQQLQQMIDAVPVNILSFAPSGALTYASKRYLEDVGPPPADIRAFDALARDVTHPDDFPVMHRRASEGFAASRPFVNRFRRRDKGGVYRWIEARAHPLHDAQGAIVQWYIASIDIEDEMHALEALRERERALRQLVETLPAMLDCAAPNGEPIYRSQQLREFLGYELEELDGSGKSRLDSTLDAGVHPDDIVGVKEQYAHSLSTGEPYARRHRLRRFDGEYRWVETRAAPMRSADGEIVQWNVICLDIDGEVRAQVELRLAQEKMARASQAASLAELSASIAHEVNQPLAAIVATSHACRRWLSADPPNLERAAITLERIIRDANSASEVVSRIRALFSQMDRARTPADITEVITEVRRLMADELAIRKINVETEFERSLPPALIDRVQIQQVFVNLIRNAVDASEALDEDSKLIRLRAIRDNDNAIRVEVRDLGPGIKEPDRVFDPFFTTKRSGMGMGLAICRSIIESHDGRLWAAANEPKGATFAFTLPIQASDMA